METVFEGVQKVIWEAIGGIINMLVSSLTKPIFDTTASLYDLIYGVSGANNYGILSESDITNAYSPSFTIMYRLAAFFVLVGIVLSGYKTSGMAINPSNRTQVIEFWKDFLIIAVVLWNLEFIYSMIFNFNSSLVEFFGGLVKEKYKDSVYSKTVNISDLVKNADSNYFYLICMNLVEAGLRLWATFFYTMRKITMLILMILGPVMVSLFLLPRYKAVTLGWLKELFGTIIVQSIHAFVFWLIIQINIGTDETSLIKILILMMFIPITEHIRALFGLGGNMQNGMAKAGAYTGLRTLSALGAVAKGAMDGQSVGDMVRGGLSKLKKNGNEDGNGLDDADNPKSKIPGANTGTDTGATAAASRMLKAGEIGSKMGKAALGAAGTLMGAPLGPEGTLIGAGLGTAAGGATGALAGRLGYAGLSKAGIAGKGLASQFGKSSKAAKDSFLNAKNGSATNDDEFVEDLTTKDFTAWKHDNPDSSLRDTLKKQFPSASDQQLDGMVQKRNQDMKQQFRNQNLSSLGKSMQDGNEYAKASDLVNAATSAYSDAYAKDNKDSFMKNLPESLTPEEKVQAWNSHLAGKTDAFKKMATSTAKDLGALSDKQSMGDGKTAFDQSFIDKNGFSNAIQTKMNSQGGQGAQTIPSAVTQAISSIPQNEKNLAKAHDLVSAATQSYADTYTKDNKASFMSSLPTTFTPEQKTEAWNSHLAGKTEAFKSIAHGAAKDMGVTFTQNSSGGNATLAENSYMDKNGFANAIQTRLSSQGATTNGMPSAITEAISSTPGQSIRNNDGSINREMFANLSAQKFIGNQLTGATNKTLDPASVATSYNMAHQSASSIPTFKAPTGVKEQAITFTKASVAGLDSFMKTMTQPISQPASVAYGLKIAEGGNSVQAALSGGSAIVNTALGANDLQRQYNVTKGVAYVGGVVAGAAGYQAAANLGSRINPFNNSVQKQTMEIGQIEQSVPKVIDSNGQEVVKQGAVRLVTTSNQSYIEMTNQGGQKQIVSRYGSGDSSIRSGQVIYQDLNISNGQLVSYGKGSQGNAYIEDTTGSKLSINRALNINPNKLVSNLNPTPLKVERAAAPSTYNAKVDSGSFFVGDVEKSGFQNVQMVIERDKSYMVGTDNTGTVTRISPFGKGDTRLEVNQRIERNCDITNKQFVVKEESLVNYGDNTTVAKPTMNLNDYNPNDLIPIMPNPRLLRRQTMEFEENVLGVSS